MIMKKVLAVAVLALASIPAMAQHWHGHGIRHGYHGGGWVAPAIIGGIIGYELSRPAPVFVQQQPVIVQNPPTVVYQPRENCSPWTEVMNPDGTITRTRTCSQ
jgi:hypothetical protein